MNQTQNVVTQKQNKTCNCGCAECNSVSCQLDCITQPRFFRGQVLNDGDLTQLLNWTQSKLRLNRFRDGWGVVCGLEVSCNCDPKKPASVTVSPGYALSACGDDLILCAEQCVDLTSVFPTNQSSCAPTNSKPRQDDTRPSKYPFPLIGDVDNIYLVDLYAHYAEEGSMPQTAYGRNNCRNLDQCENSRTNEVVHIIPKLVTDDTTIAKRDEMWEKIFRDYNATLVKLEQSNVKSENTTLETLRAALQIWLAKQKQPLHQFCFVSDWLDNPPHPGETLENGRMAFNWIGLDLLLTQMQCNCDGPQTDQVDVPLARACVQMKQEPTGKKYHVLLVNNGSPYRRFLSPDDDLIPPGKVDLRCYLWQTPEKVIADLRSLGFNSVTEEPLQIDDPSFFEYLKDLKSTDFLGSWGQVLRVNTIQNDLFGTRVVGFKYQS